MLSWPTDRGNQSNERKYVIHNDWEEIEGERMALKWEEYPVFQVRRPAATAADGDGKYTKDTIAITFGTSVKSMAGLFLTNEEARALAQEIYEKLGKK